MDKVVFIECLKFTLEQKLIETMEAANNARADATHEQSAAETQYDSLSIEYGYLAEGQSERVDTIHRAIGVLTKLYANPVSDTIQHNALVEVLDEQDSAYWFYCSPVEGGLKVDCRGRNVQLLTFDAPLGSRLKGLAAGEEIEFLFNGKQQHLLINQVK
ncbi:transcription elongation factor GreAB [Pseudoalteromonas sp. T1lg65]|uniref:transcription elongation factor GreAB n=1 Tax=Pseudoalteromonas sp. T1lg65 TaxID=2077101 RepID=UPI003F799560